MAATLNAPLPSQRISQLLPAVKCSQCGTPVPLDQLGEHVCAPAPPVPKLPLPTPTKAGIDPSSLLPARLKGLVRSSSPANQQRKSATPAPAPAPSPSRSRLSTASSRSRSSSIVQPPKIQDPATRRAPSPLGRDSRQQPPPHAPPRSPIPEPPKSPAGFTYRDTPPRTGTPASNSSGSSRGRAPSNASSTAPFRTRTPSNNAQPYQQSAPSDPRTRTRTPSNNTSPFQSNGANMMPPPTPTFRQELKAPETQSGGEAGMAGVGRRAFQAAARAAMWTTPGSAEPEPDSASTYKPSYGWDERDNTRTPMQSMDGRRSNAPPHLDIGGERKSGLGANTPPLSPESGSVSSYSPSPLSPRSPGARSSALVGSNPAIGGSRTPSPPTRLPAAQEPSTPRLPFFEAFKNKIGTPSNDKAREPDDYFDERPKSPESDYTESSSGLAYRNGSDDEDSVLSRSNTSASNKVEFPRAAGGESPPVPGRAPNRSISSASSYSRTTSAALDRSLMGPLSEEEGDAVAPLPMRVGSGRPMRANTSPTSSRTEPVVKRRVKEKQCVRCEKMISDGRWVSMDGGGVLCERCWKNMYLPKCRRCDLPIEKAAVSSSDGQLKGKYHRECFNCHTCQKPFPDKTFYVFDGKPFCAYHYHEANDSLCAAATCGQPIEGPCAVSHTGDRYHPEHLTCEYEYPSDPFRRCSVRLEDYFEVDGRMLCERHAFTQDDDEDGLDERARRAMRRTTRFIELGAGGLR